MAERDFGSRSDRNTGRPDRKPAGLGPRGASGERSSGMGSGRGGSDKRQDAPAGRAQRRDGQESRPNWQERVARPVDYDKPKSPPIPDEITEKDLEMGLRAQLKTLTPENAEKVARHLVMVNLLIEQDPELAHKHAVAAAERAGRVGERVDLQRGRYGVVARGRERRAQHQCRRAEGPFRGLGRQTHRIDQRAQRRLTF